MPAFPTVMADVSPLSRDRFRPAVKCIERMLFKLAAIIVIACCGCKTSSESKAKIEIAEKKDTLSKGETVVTQKVTTGPETITTITEEFEKATAPEGAVGPAVTTAERQPPTGNRMVPPHGALVKRTTVTDVRGPSLSESHSDARIASETRIETKAEAKATSESKSAPSGFLAFGAGLWVALGLIALLVAAWLSRGVWLPRP